MIVALHLRLEDDARLLQEVGAHVRADDLVLRVELDLDVLAEAAPAGTGGDRGRGREA